MASIIKELPELVNNNIISPQTATDIEKYYAAKKQPQGNLLLTIFGALGGILVGLGIILIFAHNWDNLTKSARTVLAIAPLLAAQLLTAYCIIKDKSSTWKNASGTLLFFTVGASIALVAQIYNLPGSLENFLLTWVLLCSPLMYLLRSNVLAVLHLVFATYYVGQGNYFDTGKPWPYLLFIAILIPYYLQQLKKEHNNTTAALNWLLPLSGFICLGGFLNGAGEFSLVIYMAFAAIMHSIGFLKPFSGIKQGYVTLGGLGILALLAGTSFRFIWSEIVTHTPNAYALATGAAFYGIAIYLYFFRKGVVRNFEPFRWAALLFPLIYCIGIYNPAIPPVLINLMVLALGIAVIREGIAKFNFGTLNFGLTIIAVLTVCRFFDSYMTFVLRGILFIGVGAGFFAANYILIQKKKHKPETVHYEN